MNGAAAAASTLPANPLPPMPSTTTFSTRSCWGRSGTPRAADTAASTCSGRPAMAPHMSRESTASGDVVVADRTASGGVHDPAGLSGGPGAAGLGLGHQAGVLRLVDRGGLVDQHDRDARPVPRSCGGASGCRAGPRRRSRAGGPCPPGRRAPRSAAGRASSCVPLSSNGVECRVVGTPPPGRLAHRQAPRSRSMSACTSDTWAAQATPRQAPRR